SLHSCTATFVQDRGTRIRPRLPPAYRRLLEQRALRSPGRFRRLDADGMLHVEITEPLMELRRGLRRPRWHALPTPAAGAGNEPTGLSGRAHCPFTPGGVSASIRQS